MTVYKLAVMFWALFRLVHSQEFYAQGNFVKIVYKVTNTKEVSFNSLM